MTPNTYLGQKGYSIYKDSISIKEQEFIRDDLTVQPYTPKALVQPPSFSIYRESPQKLYTPRYFGVNNFGVENINKLTNGESINVKFAGGLRDYQKNIVDVYMNTTKTSGGGLLEIPCGRGKCLAKGTKILMYDGNIKSVEDIIVGDVIMGDDSTPRNILSTTSGVEQMYDINLDINNETYRVNESHILSLKSISDYNNVIKNGSIIDISVKEYLELPSKLKDILYGYKVGVEFNKVNIETDPYLFGYWLINNNKVYSKKEVENNKNNNPFFNFLLKSGIIYSTSTGYELNKHIPINYKCNEGKIRSALLSGIFDACYNKKRIMVSALDTILIKDIIFLIQSLGYEYYKEVNGRLVYIYLTEPKLNKLNVVKEHIGNYYGFEIDGNRRFVLENFSVTHNTVIALNIITQLKQKTLVIVHKGFLLNQWVERIEQFIPHARIGKIQGPIFDIEDKDIVIGMLQSLSMKEYAPDMFKSFGLTIVDECHHISSEVFVRSLFTVVTKYTLGLSATMQRKDGLTRVFKMFLGDIIYSEKREKTDNVLVKAIDYKVNDEEYDELKTDYRGNPLYSSMITKLCNYNRRSEFIIKIIQDMLIENEDQQILLLAHNKSLLTYFNDSIKNKMIAEGSVGYYVGGMKEAALKLSETKKIILATYAMASEALDIKSLTTLVMATPKTDITQSVGRILRTKHAQPLVIDIIDQHEIFQNQWKKRKTFYRKNNYKIIHTNNTKYELNEWETIYEKGIVEKQKKPKCLIKMPSQI